MESAVVTTAGNGSNGDAAVPLTGFLVPAMVFVLFAGGCAAQPTPPPSAVPLTDGAGLTADDNIDGLDVAIDAADSVHVVWRERTHVWSGADRRQRLVYRRGSGATLVWGPRIVVADGASLDSPQIVAAIDGVHVFAGAKLHHWWLPKGSDGFRDLGETLRANDLAANVSEAVNTTDGLLVVFSAGQGRRAALQAVRWTGAGPQVPVQIAALQISRIARPQLLRYGDRWLVFWADNALIEMRDVDTKVTTFSAQTDVRTASSADGGIHWGRPERIVSSPNDIASIAAGAVAGAPALFFVAYGLFGTHMATDAWTHPSQLAAYKPSFLSGSSEASAVALTHCNGHATLAWVDARNRRSDRRWWNPLGGFPWGDNPDWFNNDLFVATAVPASEKVSSTFVPIRLTPPGSMTSGIAVAEHGGRLLVFRTGRARVHKAPNDADAPPQVTQLSLPCD